MTEQQRVGRRRHRHVRRGALALIVALAVLAAFAATALANQGVWLDWVTTNSGVAQQWVGQNLNYVEAQPETYNYGCSDAQNSGVEYFSNYVCSTVGNPVESMYMHGWYGYAQALNASGNSQAIWGWAGWN